MRYYGCLVSHVGKIRVENEDNACLDGHYRKSTDLLSWKYECEVEESILAAVFDGLGGEINGDIASKIAAENMAYFSGDFQTGVRKYIADTNKEIALYDIHNYMGTTIAAYYAKDGYHNFYNVGDSRVYLLSDGIFEQMTQDHNPVRRMLQEGILTKEQADRHPQRNSISQFLGLKEDGNIIEPECYQVVHVPAKKGDSVLLCTDGLTEMVSDDDIRSVLFDDCTNKEKVQMLLQKALDAGGRDNITIILINLV